MTDVFYCVIAIPTFCREKQTFTQGKLLLRSLQLFLFKPFNLKSLGKTIVLFSCFLPLSFSSKKNKKFIPPGTVQITETFFADETEIDNLAWLEYEYWTKIKYGFNSPEHIFTLPDTLVNREPLAYSEPYVEYYYRHPAYRNYPVIGVSYEQAVAFCKWRTARVKEFWALGNKTEINIEYRLPSKSEWEMLCLNGAGYVDNNGKDKKGYYKFKWSHPKWDSTAKEKFMNDVSDIVAPVKSYEKNWFGLYNMIGNVSEMISEQGISKGGNYKSSLEQCRSGKDIAYTRPESWLGFRCVCVVKK